MMLSFNTMYVIPFPDIVGGGIPVNLNTSCQKIIELQEKTNLDIIEICSSFRDLFLKLGSFSSSKDRQKQNEELLRFIHGDIPCLDAKLLSQILCLYRRDKSPNAEGDSIRTIPISFWKSVV